MITPETRLSDALKAAVVSMDSTLRSNLSVGMPLDLAVLKRDRYCFDQLRRIEQGDPQFSQVSSAWGEALKHAFAELPSFEV